MGFADVLCRMGIPYNSEEAVETAEEIMSFMAIVSPKRKASCLPNEKELSLPMMGASGSRRERLCATQRQRPLLPPAPSA